MDAVRRPICRRRRHPRLHQIRHVERDRSALAARHPSLVVRRRMVMDAAAPSELLLRPIPHHAIQADGQWHRTAARTLNDGARFGQQLLAIAGEWWGGTGGRIAGGRQPGGAVDVQMEGGTVDGQVFGQHNVELEDVAAMAGFGGWRLEEGE